MTHLRRFGLVVLLAGMASGCSRSNSEERSVLTVYAASSLTEAFGELEQAFESHHPEIDVQVAYAGSQVLRIQIENGASADVFASADERHIAALAQAGLVDDPVPFAYNELVVIVSAEAADQIREFEDLSKATRLVLGSESVPVGAYSRDMLARAETVIGPEFVEQVREHVVSEETNVRLVRAKVELGEADAAVVYRTDAMGDLNLRVIEVPSELNVEARYYMGRLTHSSQPDLADSFVEFVESSAGSEVLQRNGFRSVR
ncbi:MAG: molybdate ABC transporter substrate-binding protein, partial [Myxococcales bacterium]|nr:molybdate ABC transporter substrate-binding protein [Myxococcales bacterium]